MSHLLAICQRFTDWKPALGKPSASDRVLVKQVYERLKLNGSLYIGPDGPFHVNAPYMTPINDVIGHITSRTRDAVGFKNWRALRDQMSNRFIGHGFNGLVESVPHVQSTSFFGPGGNPHQLVAWVEDLLLTGFCLGHLRDPSAEEAVIISNLLELFLRGIYPMGMTCSQDAEISVLVLLHGSAPLLAAANP